MSHGHRFRTSPGQNIPERETSQGVKTGRMKKKMTLSTRDDGKKVDAKNKDKNDRAAVGCFQLFRFATCKDVAMMVIGSLCALIHGAAAPLMLLVYGMMTNTFVAYELQTQELKDPNKTCTNASIHWTNGTLYLTADNTTISCGLDIEAELTMFAYYYIGIGAGVLVLSYVQIVFWVSAAARQVQKIRMTYFRKVMRMEIGWFDCNSVGELNTRISDDINKSTMPLLTKCLSLLRGFPPSSLASWWALSEGGS
ncbi:hypothetical protein WMY93_002525 [Mugilogobius chulae]|uniref:ABC transmembrane type-1 domain-containing protein n=1 Tax=Mugilogobius chulae TaxID=88201 RepID=A0AAW0PWY8_9GOBI